MKTLIKYSVILIIYFSTVIYSQTIFHPLNNSGVYDFLEKMTLKRIITSNEFQKPLTRKEIATYLKIIIERKNKLNTIEKEELEWYEKEFYDELESEKYVDLNEALLNSSYMRRTRVFYYRDTLFTFSFSPSLLLLGANKEKENYFKRSWGFKLYGEITPNFGFTLGFLENSENGKTVDKVKQLSSETGVVISSNTNNNIEYSETTGSLLYGNNWITTGLTKEFFTLGSANRSQLVLSTKAPSFPSIYFRLTPARWFSYYFMHGWLFSRVTDSLATYKTNLNDKPRTIEREKYFVVHALQIKTSENLSCTLGETIIYSDKNPFLGYFIPFLFYRSVDHAISHGGSESGNNGSIFFDLNYILPSGIKTYGTLFLDEFSLTKFLKGNNSRNQLGFTLGSSLYELPLKDFMVRFEYTRILPWVYSNWIPTQTYRNSNYLLGHYIGQNADQLYLQCNYWLKRGLDVKIWAEHIRQGGISDIKNQYDQNGEKFLYGLRRNETNIGLEISYEYIYDLTGKFFYQYSKISDEDKLRTPHWQLGVSHSTGISIQYGL